LFHFFFFLAVNDITGFLIMFISYLTISVCFFKNILLILLLNFSIMVFGGAILGVFTINFLVFL